jgi:hypothetical protein
VVAMMMLWRMMYQIIGTMLGAHSDRLDRLKRTIYCSIAVAVVARGDGVRIIQSRNASRSTLANRGRGDR